MLLVRPTRIGAIIKGKTTRSRSARTGSSAGISMVVWSLIDSTGTEVWPAVPPAEDSEKAAEALVGLPGI